MRESGIEAYLVKRVKACGGEVRKVQWVGHSGAPDRLVMLPPFRITVWAELKPTGGAATFPKNPHERRQAREHERMRAMGQTVLVIDSFESVDKLIGGSK